MVTTRPKNRNGFEKGEKVLCYEPDEKKAKVLYDAKILGIYEVKDKRGFKQQIFKIHFQGWSSTWDRRVSEDFILKINDDNRQLQKDLAEKAQLQLGAYLYRREHSSRGKKKSRKSNSTLSSSVSSSSNLEGEAPASAGPSAEKTRQLSASPEGHNLLGERHEDYAMRPDQEGDTDSCSSLESFQDEERVQLRISERLREFMEYDYEMIVKYKKQHMLPARVPVISILEAFVRQTALKMIFNGLLQQTQEGTRRRTNPLRADKKEKEFDKIVNTVGLLKEVADGLRIYFDFTINDYLLYKEEREHASYYLSADNLKNFTLVPPINLTMEMTNSSSSTTKNESEASPPSDHVAAVDKTQAATTANEATIQSNSQTASNTACAGNINNTAMNSTATPPNNEEEEPQKRKLRSYRSDDCDLMSSIASTSSGASTPLHPQGSQNSAFINSYFKNLSNNIAPHIKDFVDGILAWRMLSNSAAPSASMIFGAPHLARLVVKLPEFLNSSPMSDEKLKVLLQHLETFTNFLESHKDWFNEDNYVRSSKLLPVNATESLIIKPPTPSGKDETEESPLGGVSSNNNNKLPTTTVPPAAAATLST